MSRHLWMLATVAGWVVSCDAADKPDEQASKPAAAEEAKAEPAAKADAAEAQPERKVQPLPPESVDGKAAEPEGKPEGATAPLDPQPGEGATLLTLERRSAAVKGGKLVQNVGVAALAGRFAPNLAIGCKAPCWQPAPMWPNTPTESVIDFEVYRGKTLLVGDAKRLGAFRVTSVPTPAEGARTEVVLGFGVQGGNLVAHAKVRATGAVLPLERVD